MQIQESLKTELSKEIPVLKAQIQALYRELDQLTGLRAAKVPIEFTYDREVLGSYTRDGDGEKEHFSFSLIFAGYAIPKPLLKEERLDLYKHEYAHYMQYHMTIPEKYKWQPGQHGSAWKYCCSLVGAAPTPYYKAGEALMKQDYKKVLNNPINNKNIPVLDRYRREMEYQNQKNSVVRFEIGETVRHPRYGEGTVQEIRQNTGSVHLKILFRDQGLKTIDQKWLVKTQYHGLKK